MKDQESNFNTSEREGGGESLDSTKLQRALDLLEEIESEEADERVKELIPELLDLFKGELGVELSPDVNRLYNEMSRGKYLLRVDRLSRVVNALFKKESMKVGGGGDHRANAVVPDAAHVAFAEARAPGAAVRTAFGISGFSPEDAHLQVESIDTAEDDLRKRLVES